MKKKLEKITTPVFSGACDLTVNLVNFDRVKEILAMRNYNKATGTKEDSLL